MLKFSLLSSKHKSVSLFLQRKDKYFLVLFHMRLFTNYVSMINARCMYILSVHMFFHYFSAYSFLLIISDTYMLKVFRRNDLIHY